jgi:glycogen debranching enzyme
VLSSNAGQVLRSGIACRSRASRVADLLLGPAFQSGWGIRTIADSAPRYNPMSYHNGSIWPHDNALIVSGLPLCGRGEGVERITRALFEAAAAMDHRRLPELFCGFQRRGARTPVLYPVACSPQAWSSGAVFFLLQSLLGMEIDGHARVLRFRGAMIPQWLGRVEVRNLTVGSASVDVRLRRAAGGAAIVEPIANDDDVTIELC